MNNFYFYNPTKIIFGKGMLSRIHLELKSDSKILILYGLGSVKKNGVYQKVLKVLNDNNLSCVEFGGIEPNPDYLSCMKAVSFARENHVDFILALGGGSVMDAAKFVALAFFCKGIDPWQVITFKAEVPSKVLPIGCIVTAPGTGSQMNNALVVSKRETQQKVTFYHLSLYPQFSILDPEFTFSMTRDQTALATVDTFVHVLEQYMTYPTHTLLQDRQAEAILSTLIDIGKPLLTQLDDYDLRSTLMWCGTQAVNGLLNRGTVVDWSTHEIGHLLTILFDIPHAQTLSIVLGGVYHTQFTHKLEKLSQYGQRVWQLKGSGEEVAQRSIDRTESFFESLGVTTQFASLGLNVTEVVREVRQYLEKSDFKNVGEHQNIDPETVCQILASRK